MNAYLTYAAMIGAGLCGIDEGLEPPAEFKGNGYIAKDVPRMPRALYEAIGELERSEAAPAIFGQDVVDHYLNAARVEQDAVRLDGPRLGARALPRTKLAPPPWAFRGSRRPRRPRRAVREAAVGSSAPATAARPGVAGD